MRTCHTFAVISVFVLALLGSTPDQAHSQGALLQGGATTSGHAPVYVTQGSGGQTVVQDSGGAGGGGPGVGLSELNITARGTGTAPFSGQGTGFLGTNVCDYDAPITNPTGYHFLCFSANATGGNTTIATGAAGGASALPVIFNINGTSYAFPGAFSSLIIGATGITGGTNGNCLIISGVALGQSACGSNITIGTSTITGGTPNGLIYDNAGVFGNLTTGNNGVLVTSAGGVPSISTTLPSSLSIASPTLSGTIPGNPTLTGTWNFTGTFSVNGIAQTFPASGVLVGTTDTQTFQGKTFDTSAPGNVLRIGGTGVSSVTGSGAVVLANSPTFTTPNLGVANATSINGLAITPSTGTLTIANSKTFVANNTITLNGTDSTTFTFPSASDSVVTLAATQTLTNKSISATEVNSGSLLVANGGTGATTLTAHGVLVGEGTGTVIAVGTASNSLCLLSNGSSSDPTWGSCSGSTGTGGAYVTVTGSVIAAPFVASLVYHTFGGI